MGFLLQRTLICLTALSVLLMMSVECSCAGTMLSFQGNGGAGNIGAKTCSHATHHCHGHKDCGLISAADAHHPQSPTVPCNRSCGHCQQSLVNEGTTGVDLRLDGLSAGLPAFLFAYKVDSFTSALLHISSIVLSGLSPPHGPPTLLNLRCAQPLIQFSSF